METMERNIKYLKKKKTKAVISCIILTGLSIYGVFFSEEEFAKAVSIISSTVAISQWLMWSATESLLEELKSEPKKE